MEYGVQGSEKEIKIYVPAYSSLGSYYTDDVNLAIYRNEELIIESIAESHGIGGNMNFNSDLEDVNK